MSSRIEHPSPPSRADMAGHKAFARALASASRLVILSALASGDRPTTELREMLGVSGPLLSWHLRVLKQEGLVSARRRGRGACYHLNKAELMRKYQILIQQAAGPNGK